MQYGNFEAEVIKISDTPADSSDGLVKYPVKLRLDTDNFDIKYGSKVITSIMIGEAPAIYTLLNMSSENQVIQRRIEMLRKKSERRKAGFRENLANLKDGSWLKKNMFETANESAKEEPADNAGTSENKDEQK